MFKATLDRVDKVDGVDKGSLTMMGVLTLISFFSVVAFAATPNEAIAALRTGDLDGALGLFQELQLEQPENPQVLYGLGCVQYQRGLAQMQAQTPEDAQSSFSEAQTAFNSVLAGSAETLHANAGFNLGNVLTQEAQLAPKDKPKVMIAKWREAIGAYERVLEKHPEHTGAKQNLDFARYQLKLLLQAPEEEKKEEGEEKKEDEQKPVMVMFKSATTDIPGAQAVPTENTVQLVQPGATP